MFDRATLLKGMWYCHGRTFHGAAFFSAILLPLLLPVITNAQKPLVLPGIRDVYRVAFSPNSQILAATSSDGAVYLWDLTAEKPPHVIAAEQASAWLVRFTPDGQQLVTVGGTERGLSVQRWNTATGEPEGEREIEGWQGGGKCLCLSHDCTKVAVSTNTAKTVLAFDVKSGQKLLTLNLPDMVGAAVFSPDNSQLVTAFNKGKQVGKLVKITATVRFTHVSNGNQDAEFPVPFRVQALDFARDGKALAMGGHRVKIWDWHKWKQEDAEWTEDCELRKVRSEHLALSPDGRLVACRDQVWNLQTKKLLLKVKGKGAHGPLALSPDGKKLAIAVGRELHVYALPSVAASKPHRPSRVKKEE